MVKDLFILDTSAIIAYLADEKEASEVEKVIPEAKIPFICLSELYYLIWRKRGRSDADKMYAVVKSWALSVLYPNERVILNAGRFKAVHKLGISDSYIAAFTLEEDAVLVTKDKDYQIINEEIGIKFL